MLRIGLTGSIGMGKSTTAGLFRDLGIPVHDADQTVHDLYRNEAVKPIQAVFPDVVKNGVVDRQALSKHLATAPQDFRTLEAIVHPLVGEKERSFIAVNEKAGKSLVLLDIPLLFEGNAINRVDKVIVVSCDPEIQKQRVLARPSMTLEKFNAILARQMPDAEKRKRADYVIDTGKGIESARERVAEIVRDIENGMRESRGE